MRGMAITFFSLCVASAAPASSPSVVAPAETRHDAHVRSAQSAAGQMPGTSVVQAREADMPVTQETVSAIPERSGPARATMVIRDGVVGSALPRPAAKPAVANGKQPATAVSAKAGKDGLAKGQKLEATR